MVLPQVQLYLSQSPISTNVLAYTLGLGVYVKTVAESRRKLKDEITKERQIDWPKDAPYTRINLEALVRTWKYS
jgi:hypothetical protein